MAKPKTTQQVNTYDEALANFAKDYAEQEANVGGGKFFSVKGGVLRFDDQTIPGNEMGVIILDHILENVFYEAEYDAENPTPPACFAFGRDEKVMCPHENSMKPVHEKCLGCPNNEFGTADRGRGKACRNTRRLAMIPAGEMIRGKFEAHDDVDHFTSTQIGYMKLPVTSVKGFAAYVKQLAAAHKRPPFAVFTKVRVVPDPKSTFRVEFEFIDNVPNELIEALMSRHEEAKELIEFPYAPAEEKPEPAKKDTKRPRKFK